MDFKVGDKVKARPDRMISLGPYNILAGQMYIVRRIIHEQIILHYIFLELEGVSVRLNALFFDYYKASTAFVLNDEDD